MAAVPAKQATMNTHKKKRSKTMATNFQSSITLKEKTKFKLVSFHFCHTQLIILAKNSQMSAIFDLYPTLFLKTFRIFQLFKRKTKSLFKKNGIGWLSMQQQIQF